MGASAGLGDADEVHDALAALNGRKVQTVDAQGQARSVSPRKRRAGGVGAGAAGGAGGKRRRKEVDDGDGTYPNPVGRRTRNPRGAAVAAVASPLAGPALVADGHAGEAEGEGEEGNTPGEAAEAEVTRPTRSRRSRVPASRRRNSSASETTTTSVSVSIAANARGTRSAATKKTSDGEAPVDEDTFEAVPQPEDKLEETESAGSADNNHSAPAPGAVEAKEDDAVKSPPDTSMETEKVVEIPEKAAPEEEEAQRKLTRHEDSMDIGDTSVPEPADVAGDVDASSKRALTPKSSPDEEAKMEVDSVANVDKSAEPKAQENEKASQPHSTTSPAALLARSPSTPSAHAPAPPVAETTRLPPSTRPIPASVIPKSSVADDEKEEGELSDE